MYRAQQARMPDPARLTKVRMGRGRPARGPCCPKVAGTRQPRTGHRFQAGTRCLAVSCPGAGLPRLTVPADTGGRTAGACPLPLATTSPPGAQATLSERIHVSTAVLPSSRFVLHSPALRVTYLCAIARSVDPLRLDANPLVLACRCGDPWRGSKGCSRSGWQSMRTRRCGCSSRPSSMPCDVQTPQERDWLGVAGQRVLPALDFRLL